MCVCGGGGARSGTGLVSYLDGFFQAQAKEISSREPLSRELYHSGRSNPAAALLILITQYMYNRILHGWDCTITTDTVK